MIISPETCTKKDVLDLLLSTPPNTFETVRDWATRVGHKIKGNFDDIYPLVYSAWVEANLKRNYMYMILQTENRFGKVELIGDARFIVQVTCLHSCGCVADFTPIFNDNKFCQRCASGACNPVELKT